jgi:hypothetical protein
MRQDAVQALQSKSCGLGSISREKEIHLPARVKNRFPLILPLSSELAGMLKMRFQHEKPDFVMTNFRKEWEKACVKVGQGQIEAGKDVGKKKWYQYKGLIPYHFRRSAARNPDRRWR